MAPHYHPGTKSIRSINNTPLSSNHGHTPTAHHSNYVTHSSHPTQHNINNNDHYQLYTTSIHDKHTQQEYTFSSITTSNQHHPVNMSSPEPLQPSDHQQEMLQQDNDNNNTDPTPPPDLPANPSNSTTQLSTAPPASTTPSSPLTNTVYWDYDPNDHALPHLQPKQALPQTVQQSSNKIAKAVQSGAFALFTPNDHYNAQPRVAPIAYKSPQVLPSLSTTTIDRLVNPFESQEEMLRTINLQQKQQNNGFFFATPQPLTPSLGGGDRNNFNWSQQQQTQQQQQSVPTTTSANTNTSQQHTILEPTIKLMLYTEGTTMQTQSTLKAMTDHIAQLQQQIQLATAIVQDIKIDGVLQTEPSLLQESLQSAVLPQI